MTSDKYELFSLERALAGEKVLIDQGDGHIVRVTEILPSAITDALAVFVDGSIWSGFRKDGIRVVSGDRLVMAPKEPVTITMYANVRRDMNGELYGFLHSTENSADRSQGLSGYVAVAYPVSIQIKEK